MVTIYDIKGYISQAPIEAIYMIVIYEDFAYKGYPMFVLKGENLTEKKQEIEEHVHPKTIEVFNLKEDIEFQLLERTSIM